MADILAALEKNLANCHDTALRRRLEAGLIELKCRLREEGPPRRPRGEGAKRRPPRGDGKRRPPPGDGPRRPRRIDRIVDSIAARYSE